MEIKIEMNRIKKIIFKISFCILCFNIYANDYPLIKIFECDNNQNSLIIRKDSEVAPQDDCTGNKIVVSTDGLMFIHCHDRHMIYKLDIENAQLYEVFDVYNIDSNGKEINSDTWLDAVTEKGFLFSGSYTRAHYIDYSQKELFSTCCFNWGMRIATRLNYYDEECDVLFFRDEKSNLYSIEHPSMDEAQNKANFKGPSETIAMLNSGKYAPHLSTNQYKELCVDGNFYFWEGKLINGKRYQLFSENQVKFYPTLKRDGMIDFIFKVPYGDVESIAIHPCGDLYMLGINWNTNTHILYRVENTWDPEWRASWYAAYPDAPGRE